jgi:hypothetical protein
MSEDDSSRDLTQLAENIGRLRRQKVWLTSLEQHTAAARRKSDEWKRKLREEEQDVERLEHSALTRFVMTLFDESKLEREQQEAAEAAVRWEQAEAERQALEAELERTTAQVRQLDELETRYNQALEGQTSRLLSGPAEVAAQLKEKLDEEDKLRQRCETLRRANSSANAASAKLREARDRIGSARSWGKYDLWLGGGAVSSHLKRSRIDHAANAVLEAQLQLDALQLELQELGEQAHFPAIRTEVGYRLMDVFLDNIFTDLAVQRRIEEMQKSIEEATDAVERQRGRLAAAVKDAERLLDQAVAVREQYVREKAI